MSKLSILLAYPYFYRAKSFDLLLANKSDINLMVDSGAFTAFMSGKVIELDDYCRFLDSIEKLRPFHAVQLDIIGNPHKTWENYLLMKKRGFDVMPVFTHGDTLDMLDEMYRHTDYILVGGIANGGKKQNFLKWFMNNNKGRAVHWLGFVNMNFIKYFKPTSVDSSSCYASRRFGNLQLHDGFGNIKTIEFGHYLKDFKIINELLEKQPYSFKDLKSKDHWRNNNLQKFSTFQNIDRNIKTQQKLGTKIYMAGQGHQLKDILMVWEDYKNWTA